MMQLGNELAVRLPRRELAVPLIEHEQRWLPELSQAAAYPVRCRFTRVKGPYHALTGTMKSAVAELPRPKLLARISHQGP